MNLFDEKVAPLNKEDDITSEDYELSAIKGGSIPKSKTRISTSSSISNLNEKKNPLLTRYVLVTSMSVAIASLISCIYSVISKHYLLFDFKIQDEGILVTLSFIMISILNLLICLCSLLYCKGIFFNQDEKLINITITTLKFYFPSVNLLLSIMYLLGIFMNTSSSLFLVLLSILSFSACCLLYFFYQRVKRKRLLDLYSLITVSVYISIITVVISYTFLYNSSELIISGVEDYEYARRLRRTLINVFQILIGIVLMSYHHDIIFMFGTVLLIYTPELIMSVGRANRSILDLIILIALGYGIIFWKIYKAGKAVFGLQKDDDDSNLIKMRTVSKTSHYSSVK